jgi:rhamnopyranosyl-N-acetylglucosaminyl-diphospho-decaprenol beta-1,3/1,4-galactofuranosyltransferase
MNETVCAVVVTYNRKKMLGPCLRSLLAQKRPIDKIIIVDNASTDNTRDFLAKEFPELEVLALPENSGGAGGFRAGMRWAYERQFDWVWIMDDDVEAMPDALESLLAYRDIGDLIQGRKYEGSGNLIWEAMWDASSCSTITFSDDLSFKNGKQWTSISYANFEGALIKRKVMERIGFPDDRYFIASDDTIYGFLVSLHFHVIYVDFVSMHKKADPPKTRSRFYYYFQLRNRFLNYEHFVKAGVPVRHKMFLIQSFLFACTLISEIVRNPNERKLTNVTAVFMALRDGLAGRFGRPAWLS